MPCTVSPGMARKPCRRRLLHRPQSPSAAATAPIMSSLAHVPAEETAPAEEASGSAGSNDIMLQYFCKASCKYITQMKDGTSKRHPVFKGPDGFLKTKVFGKLKELDVPNLFMQTFENAAAMVESPRS